MWCILGTFALVISSAASSPASAPFKAEHDAAHLDDYLQIVEGFFDKQPRQSFLSDNVGLMQTYGPDSFGGGDCPDCALPDPCPAMPGHCRFDVYDNALAAMYYTKRGQLEKAKQILDAFLHYLYPTKHVPNSYKGEFGRQVTLLAAAYSDVRADAGQYDGDGVADGAVDVGNNAYAGMALAKFAAAADSQCHAAAARDILFVISQRTACDDNLGGFMGRLEPFPANYRSTEHSIDMFALARMLGAPKIQEQAAKFVKSMHGQNGEHPGAYITGTGSDSPCDTSLNAEALPVDCQLWNLAAGADLDWSRMTPAVAFSVTSHTKDTWTHGHWEEDTDFIGNIKDGGLGQGDAYFGFRFSNEGNGIQWENTGSGLVALVKYRSLQSEGLDVSDFIVKVRQSLKQILAVYKSVPASILGGNYASWEEHQGINATSVKFPGGSDTGLGWPYFRYPHVASTAWTGLALMHQFDEGQPIDPEANPYEKPNGEVPQGDVSMCPSPSPAPFEALV